MFTPINITEGETLSFLNSQTSEDGGREERKYEPKLEEEKKIGRGWALKGVEDLCTRGGSS
jgi:hypothetical protein